MGKKKVVEQSGVPKSGESDAAIVPKKSGGVRKAKKIETGRVYISASYNNTVVSITDAEGNVIHWASAGSVGFKGPQKATPFAASKIVTVIAEKVKPLGLTTIEVFVKGIGGGRDSAVRSLINHGFTITAIKDVTPVPHNGPRPKKVRRV